ncbi:MAG: SMC-Scp complex subunit ScpB [Planctomycetes bacterium]|nr:SMC-Scp complex subunit ScpB [Planctomycetota bacterium]
MLFVGSADNAPHSSRQLAGLMRGVGPREIGELVQQLNDDYAANNCPYQIVSEGAGYRLALRESMAGLRARFGGRVREARLSPVAIEVLAIVAYHQPVTNEEVSDARGRSSSGVLSQLVRRQLLRIERASEKPRMVHYFTTDRFLKLFGMGNLDDLPHGHELERA